MQISNLNTRPSNVVSRPMRSDAATDDKQIRSGQFPPKLNPVPKEGIVARPVTDTRFASTASHDARKMFALRQALQNN